MSNTTHLHVHVYIYHLYSCVHDHANSHCFMKILGGNLKETQFEWPQNYQLGAEETTPLTQKACQVHSTNDVTYINGM